MALKLYYGNTKVIMLIHKPNTSNDLVNNRSFTVIADHLTTEFIRE